MGKYIKELRTALLYGGDSLERQKSFLKAKPQIVIATPGRLMDHMRRKNIDLSNVSMVIMDEGDEMLNMGFKEDIEDILKSVPTERQTLLFSATIPAQIKKIAKEFLTDYETIKVKSKSITVSTVEQEYYNVNSTNKSEALFRLIEFYDVKKGMVFCNTKQKVDELTSFLQAKGYKVSGLHGDMRQQQRTQILQTFKRGNIQILIASDVAARGLDVDDIEIVFNYDVPFEIENYVHRIGRTGRAGKSGRSVSLISGRRQENLLEDIKRETGANLKKKDVPSARTIEKIRDEKLMNSIEDIIAFKNKEDYTSIINKLEKKGYDLKDIASALLMMVQTNKKETNTNQDDMNDDFNGVDKQEIGMTKILLNAGRKQGINQNIIVKSIAEASGIKGKTIGRIDIQEYYSYVDVPTEYLELVLQTVKNYKTKDFTLTATYKKGKKK